MSFLDEPHSFGMSEKELFFRMRQWVFWLFVKRRAALALLCFALVMWGTPLGLKWFLVQPLHVTAFLDAKLQASGSVDAPVRAVGSFVNTDEK